MTPSEEHLDRDPRGSVGLSDTGPEALARQVERWRSMTYAAKAKVDLFFLGDSDIDRGQIERGESIEVAGVDGSLWVTSAPDLILRKSWWFRLGREVSDRQWNDVLSLPRVQRPHLDRDRLRADSSPAQDVNRV